MRKLFLLLLLLVGCQGTNEQVATCVQNCKSISAKMAISNENYRKANGNFICVCKRVYEINEAANNTQEIEQ